MAVVFFVSFAIAVGFAAFTEHAWEDYYITFRSSKNLVQGHGLVFTPGERVHSFTSPLGVLLPAAASWITGGESDAAALWLFRVMGAAALAGAAALLFSGTLRLGGDGKAAWLTAGFVALEAKCVDFSTNGMETGFLLLFLAWTYWALTRDSRWQYRHLGAAWAGIMWTRPDGFIYIGLLAAGYGVFHSLSAGKSGRREALVLLLKAAVVCTVLYLPWFVWAWIYYGSPVPHTIVAKGSMNPGRNLPGFLTTFALLPWKLWFGGATAEGALMPTYYQAVQWPILVKFTARLMGFVATVAWMWPRLHPATRAASLTFHGAHAYLTYFPYFPFPWYFPGTTILGAMVWGGIAARALAGTPVRRVLPWLAAGLAGWLLLVEAGLLAASAVQMRAKQQIVYTGNLRRIGEWLRENAKPTDRVFLEPLGYIGYFSGLRAYDYPGLSSPEMVAARARFGNGWSGLLLALNPQWVVLRRPEAERIESEAPGLLREYYEPVKTFDVRDQARAARVPDHFMLEFDADFTLHRRRSPTFSDEELLGIQHTFGTSAPVRSIDGVPMRMIHATGTLSLRIPADAKHYEVKFGFPSDAYDGDHPTDGATFQLIWAEGSDFRVLAERTLDPRSHPQDRGVHSFTGMLPAPKSGPARLLLHTKAGKTNTKDWTCWGLCIFR